MINLFKVYMSPKVSGFVMPVLQSGYVGEGVVSRDFEKKFGEFIKNPNVAIVNSGTSAITMSLILAGIGHGDKVISTPVTCLATNMAILSVGAMPVWADVLPDGTIDVGDVEVKLKNNEVKAIMCMDWGGLPCELDELNAVAKKYGVPLIEDACQSVGAKYNGRPVGNDADFTCFSFQAIKHLTSVDGGIVAFRDKKHIETAKMMRWFGLDRTKGADMRCNQDPPVAGYKWQMNDVLASIGLANMEGLRKRLAITKRHAETYNETIGYQTNRKRKSSYWLYTIFVKDVDGFIKYMKDNGVECSRVHDRNDTKTVFKDSRTDLPGVDWFDEHHVCIPVGFWLSDEDIEQILFLIDKQRENLYHNPCSK